MLWMQALHHRGGLVDWSYDKKKGLLEIPWEVGGRKLSYHLGVWHKNSSFKK